MTKPEIRYYKDGQSGGQYNAKKIVSHMSSSNHIAHDAPAPVAHSRGEAKTTARMMTSSINNPNMRDNDTFTAPAKRTAAA